MLSFGPEYKPAERVYVSVCDGVGSLLGSIVHRALWPGYWIVECDDGNRRVHYSRLSERAA